MPATASQKSPGVFHQTREAGHSIPTTVLVTLVLYLTTQGGRYMGAHSLREHSLSWKRRHSSRSVDRTDHLVSTVRSRRETGKGTHPSDPFPPVRSYPEVVTKCSNTGVYVGHFIFKTYLASEARLPVCLTLAGLGALGQAL